MKNITRREFNKIMGTFGAVSALENFGRGPTLLLAAVETCRRRRWWFWRCNGSKVFTPDGSQSQSDTG